MNNHKEMMHLGEWIRTGELREEVATQIIRIIENPDLIKQLELEIELLKKQLLKRVQ